MSDALFTASIKRGADGKTVIAWRSEFLEQIWSAMAGGATAGNYWNVGTLTCAGKTLCKRGGSIYTYAIDSERVNRYIPVSCDFNLMQSGDRPNLAPLLLVGLGKGLETTIDHPVPTVQLKQWAERTTALVNSLIETMNPVDITIMLEPAKPKPPTAEPTE